MLNFHITGLPDRLPRGVYGTQVVDTEWREGQLHITIEYRADIGPTECAFPITADCEIVREEKADA